MARTLPVPRPFVKWAGGKGQLLELLLENIPHRFKTYCEPFVGGGALFFALYRAGKIKQALLSDVNPELIDTYIALRDDVEDVIDMLSTYPYDKEFYYEMRSRDPWKISRTERAARFIYLNKTCFNGLYRLNRSGKFNVPFGRYVRPKICDAKNLRAVSKALRHAEIMCEDFQTVVHRLEEGDFVYCDPPYQPVSDTAYFTAYTADGFHWEDQVRLFKTVEELKNRGIYVLLSNSAHPKVKDLYAQYTIWEVPVKRHVNRRAERRRGWVEVLISTYA